MTNVGNWLRGAVRRQEAILYFTSHTIPLLKIFKITSRNCEYKCQKIDRFISFWPDCSLQQSIKPVGGHRVLELHHVVLVRLHLAVGLALVVFCTELQNIPCSAESFC